MSVETALNEFIRDLEESLREATNQPEEPTPNKPSTQCIDEIVEGTLNSYLEGSTFPSSEQVHVLSMLLDLKGKLHA